jgi:hypothetical protein
LCVCGLFLLDYQIPNKTEQKPILFFFLLSFRFIYIVYFRSINSFLFFF